MVTSLVGGLVAINLAFSHINWEFHHPNWRTPIFQRGEKNHQPVQKCKKWWEKASLWQFSHMLSIIEKQDPQFFVCPLTTGPIFSDDSDGPYSHQVSKALRGAAVRHQLLGPSNLFAFFWKAAAVFNGGGCRPPTSICFAEFIRFHDFHGCWIPILFMAGCWIPLRPQVPKFWANVLVRWGFTNDNRLKPNKRSTTPGPVDVREVSNFLGVVRLGASLQKSKLTHGY